MNNEKAIIAHLTAHGCTDIAFDGAWVTFKARDGSKGYASRSDLVEEWKRGR